MRRGSLIGCLLALGGCGADPGAPYIRTTPRDNTRIVLSASIDSLLQTRLPSFRLRRLVEYHHDIRDGYKITSKQLPWAVIGDFNGDSVPDVVLAGRTDTHEVLVGVLSTPTGPDSLIVLDEVVLYPDLLRNPKLDALLHQPAGIVRSNVSADTLALSTEAFHRYYWEKAGSIYYYRNGRFYFFASSD